MSEKIKIGYFADGPWSHQSFERIIKNKNIEIAFIVPRFDTKDKTLQKYSVEYGVDYFLLENINSSDSIDKISSYNCDLLVSMSFNQIFKKSILKIAPKGVINCHAGKLPFYRGRNILNWALINDEKEFGITVHYVDEGIDTGDIILQRVYPITNEDTYATLLEIAYVECANILYDTLVLFIENEVERVPQKYIHNLGMYCGRRTIGDEIIDWNQSSREIFNFIRSICKPGPQATTYCRDEKVLINKAHYLDNAPVYIGKPGQILSKTKEGFLVKTKDSFIEILEITGKLRVGETFI